MSPTAPHGVIDHLATNRRTDYLFRVSIKCLIRNDRGEVLVVKESGRDWWDLPGGGMDHGEDVEGAIAREMGEEVCLRGNFSFRVIAVESPSFLKHVNIWQLRIVFEVSPDNMMFEAGEDGDEVAFIDAASLEASGYWAERKVCEYAQKSKDQSLERGVPMLGNYPNCFYRVSEKALITDPAGRVLVVKERQDTWSLPGGGLDHGEAPGAGLARELSEEIGLDESSVRIGELATSAAFYLERKQAWVMWLVYRAEVLTDHPWVLGEGVTAAEWIAPAELSGSDDVFEKTVYEVCGRLS